MIKVGDLIEWQGELHIVVGLQKYTTVFVQNGELVILFCPITNEKYKVPTNFLGR
jgi:hypothetical protein